MFVVIGIEIPAKQHLDHHVTLNFYTHFYFYCYYDYKGSKEAIIDTSQCVLTAEQISLWLTN